MKNVDIVYLIEHVSRELDVACAVKYYAESRHKLKIEILKLHSSSDLQYAIANLHPQVVVIPCSYRATDAGTSILLPHWRKVIYLNMAWEQLHYKANLENKAPADEFSQRHVLHHAWGNFYRDYLMQHGVPESHILMNGQPAYKLYDEPYARYHVQRSDLAKRYGLDPEKRWIFFPENYGWGFYTDRRLKEIVSFGVDRSTAYELREFCRKSFSEVMRWCHSIASDPSVEVIVRPRPGTPSLSFLRSVIRAVGHPVDFHIIKMGSVREWILASDITLSSYSTTLIEAAIAGKSAYMVLPYPLPDGLLTDWYAHARQLETFDEFRLACSGTENSAGTDELRQWARKEMMSYGDAIANISDILAKLCRPEFRRAPALPTDILPSRDRMQRVRPRPYQAIRKYLWMGLKGLGMNKALVMDTFDQKEIARRTDKWGNILQRTGPNTKSA